MRKCSEKIAIPNRGAVSVLWSLPDDNDGELLFAYAPGAGSSLNDPFGSFLAERLAAAGIQCLRFQFPYMEAGRSLPDRNSVLEATWRAAIDAAWAKSPSVAIGGRSMGGRIASQVVARGVEVVGLALFAYPLHPPGRPDKTRDEHLRSIMVPTLFCSGSHDAFATPAELEAAAALVNDSEVHLIMGADHGFNVPKSTGLTRQDVWEEAFTVLLPFLEALA